MTSAVHRWTRRGLLSAAFAAGAGAAFAYLRVRSWMGAPAEDPGGLRALSADEFRTMQALSSALFPVEGSGEFLARAFDGFLADEPKWHRQEAKQALWLLEVGPIVFAKARRPFSALEEQARRELFDGWAAGDDLLRRKVAVGLRRFCSLVFYDRPEAWAAIQYPGPMFAAAAQGAAR